jgi:hypothetical protein
MRIIVGCEMSQIVTMAFREKGHEAYSCDIIATQGIHPEWHYQEDILELLKRKRFDLGIFHPPCTYVCSSGLHWNKRVPGREEKTKEAIEFIKELFFCNIPLVALENPVGCINTRIPFMPKPQYIQPYEFGHDASKKTGLWLKGLPPLMSTLYVEPRLVEGKPRWGNQTDSGQNCLGPSETRAAERSLTYGGIAKAMSNQWG